MTAHPQRQDGKRKGWKSKIKGARWICVGVLSRGYDCVPLCLRTDREVILRRKLDVPRFVLRSCTCPRAIRSCGIIEFHWIRSVPADRIDDCVRELLLRNSSDRGLLSIERPRRGGGGERTNRIISKMARGILFAARNARERREGERGFRIDSVQILIVTSPRKARNLRGPFSGW